LGTANKFILSTMRKILLALVLCALAQQSIAKEGMWLPFLLQQLNEKDMQSMGLKITAQDIYSESKSSLKDAVLIFGSGCTGEVISKEGLVLTNHHCGYGTVNGLSSLQNDYLRYGFWAKNNGEELPCTGLSVTFIVKIVDVTATLTKDLSDDLTDTARSAELGRRQKALIKENTKDGYGANIKSFFSDNKYFMFITEKFTDVRLVGFPPNGIGKFGGDTDNWAWPRHTGDFSLFRIYANKDNKPSEYNKDNVPFKPRKFFNINIGGVKPGDFTWVYGFPGRTQQNLTSAGVNELMTVLDPARIKIREQVLNIMDEDMRNDRGVYLKYAGKQAGIANYYKKWQGELKGLQINKATDKKKSYEAEFTTWLNANPDLLAKYGDVLGKMNDKYEYQKDKIILNEYFNEAWENCESLTESTEFAKLIAILEKTKSVDSIKKFKANWQAFYKGYHRATDKRITLKMLQMMKEKFPDMKVDVLNNAEKVYEACLVNNEKEMLAIFDETDANKVLKKLQNDEGYKAAIEMYELRQNNFDTYSKNQFELIALYHKWVQAKMLKAGTKPFYPDANSTLRVSYGKVEGLRPEDGKIYDYYTTLDGAIMKDNPEIEEFEVPAKLKELHASKNYGRYALPNGQMPLAFIASNHTTGGNSGSPVLNAKGELIGTNFDRIYEGTMSDVMYDINLCRNITLDVRYTLFIIEKFGEAGWLLNEMNIVGAPMQAIKGTKAAKKRA
jgi:hypothetical protein